MCKSLKLGESGEAVVIFLTYIWKERVNDLCLFFVEINLIESKT